MRGETLTFPFKESLAEDIPKLHADLVQCLASTFLSQCDLLDGYFVIHERASMLVVEIRKIHI